jgi:hypothetical protein
MFLVSAAIVCPQQKSNYDVLGGLIKKSVSQIDSVLGDSKKNMVVNLSVPQLLEQLKPELISSFNNNGFILKSENGKQQVLNFTLIDASINYKNPFTDGFFGDAMVEREAVLKGTYFSESQNGIGNPVNFSFTAIDTVNMDEISDLENKALPFTQGNIPPRPVLSSLLEPVIIVGSLVATVIILFTVRGK